MILYEITVDVVHFNRNRLRTEFLLSDISIDVLQLPVRRFSVAKRFRNVEYLAKRYSIQGVKSDVHYARQLWCRDMAPFYALALMRIA